MNHVLLIIPAYNEAGNIERVVDNLMDNYAYCAGIDVPRGDYP